jgi:hypothetical protein
MEKICDKPRGLRSHQSCGGGKVVVTHKMSDLFKVVDEAKHIARNSIDVKKEAPNRVGDSVKLWNVRFDGRGYL